MNIECDRCGELHTDKDLTDCIHFDTMEILGRLCDDCIDDYMQFLHALKIDGVKE